MSRVARHTLFDDAQSILVAPLLFAFAILLLREAGLLTGGTVGIAFLIHYASGWPLGLLVFVINLPFYLLGLRVLGAAFTLKTFVAIALLSGYAELLPRLIRFAALDPLAAAILGGFLAGISLLMLIRHGASLGGLGILVIYLQKTRGWRAGLLQGLADCLILAGGLLVRDVDAVALSVVSALALNLVIAANHRDGRYLGT